MKNKTSAKFYNILTEEGANEATILMYGYIGEYWKWDPEAGYKREGVTDIEFVQELNRLAAAYPTIHLRINSPGGQVFHGQAIVNAIRTCSSEVHTWLDGVAASMAGVIWAAGHRRHMATNALLMLHAASDICWGNAAEMRDMADILGKVDESLCLAVAEATGMPKEKVATDYFDGKDHWLTSADVQALGWLSDATEPAYKASAKMPTDPQAMAFDDLVRFFAENAPADPPSAKPAADRSDFWNRAFDFLKKAVDPGTNPQPSPSNTTDMTFEDFKNSLTTGDLSIEAVRAHLATLDTPPPATDEAAAALRAEVAELKSQQAAMLQRIEALGAAPGAGRATPGAPDADAPGQPQNEATARLAAMNQQFAAAAAANEPLRVVPAAQ